MNDTNDDGDTNVDKHENQPTVTFRYFTLLYQGNVK